MIHRSSLFVTAIAALCLLSGTVNHAAAQTPPQPEQPLQSPDWQQRLLEGAQDSSNAQTEDNDALPDIQATPRSNSLDATDLSTNNPGLTLQTPGSNQPAVSPEELEAGIRKEAYDAAVTGLFPLTPEQIKQLLKHYEDTAEAAETPTGSYPEPEVVVQDISLDPGVVPPTINVAVGHVTTLTILDITGAPWPVHDVSWAGDFEVVEPQEGGHMIRITPMSEYAYGNLSIRLLTLKTPVTLTLRTSKEKVHYRMDARVPEYGPMAKASLIQGGTQISAGNPVMTSVLDGVMPTGAQKMDVSGVDGRTTAYRLGDTLYVRTPLSLLSPGWQSSVSSADGMNVYTLNNTPVILLSDDGKFARAMLTDKKDLFDE